VRGRDLGRKRLTPNNAKEAAVSRAGRAADDAMPGESAEQLRIAVEVGNLGTWSIDFVTGRVTLSTRCKAHFGVGPDDELTRTRADELVHPADRERVKAARQKAIHERTDYDAEYRVVWPDGSLHWIIARGRASYDAAGTAIAMTGVTMDTTERRRSEEAMRERAALVQVISDGTPTLLYVKDREGRMKMANAATLHALGRSPDQVIGKTAIESWPDKESAAKVMANDQRLMESGEPLTFEEIVMMPDGPHMFLSTKTPQRDERGNVVGLIGASIDITDRMQAEERQKLLINELNHRVKNTLATVQSIARQTARTAPAPEAFVARFESRLLALSRAHDLLTRGNWENVRAGDIVEAMMAPHRETSGNRIVAEGPEFRVSPRVALAFGLALHELATNAAKYGALSTAAGRVEVAWRRRPAEPGGLELRWVERGGPPVAPPTHKGFGSRLIESALAQELGCDVRLEFPRGGVECTVVFEATAATS
jgi:PAS domain S-box-containing protein